MQESKRSRYRAEAEGGGQLEERVADRAKGRIDDDEDLDRFLHVRSQCSADA